MRPDSLCTQKIQYYREFTAEFIGTLWEKAPSLSEQGYKRVKELREGYIGEKYDRIAVAVLINMDGHIECIELKEISKEKNIKEIYDQVDKEYLLKNIGELKFEPATQKGKTVESCFFLYI